ncbi:uncharacterized protein LOC108855155 [Raphanus sativus]|uniref:Uncharacterized protein LOC108855155 n=1 Tax=Raphanus sativus TaxID=3726 RepID=A0A6J0NI16_RAPSA|nr:uncharacterized protein LOC108855155 [Raphanus sativus]
MDSESLRTMALLEARSEYKEMNEEDVEFDVEEELTETEAEIQTEAEVQTETQATASTQAAKPQRTIEDLFDENENVQKKQVIQELNLQHQKIEVFDRIMEVIRCV